MKPIRLTAHAKEQCLERGASETEVREAIERGIAEPARRGRSMYRLNLPYGANWQGERYAIKQVAPVAIETENEIIVVTVYTFYF